MAEVVDSAFPIDGKDRTFFWAAFKGYRQETFLSDTITVPTELERAGDFSKSGVTIIDPTTGQPFPGNVIPANRFDPVGAKLVQYFPLPRNGQSRLFRQKNLRIRRCKRTAIPAHGKSANRLSYRL
jgi:hypothetical protein